MSTPRSRILAAVEALGAEVRALRRELGQQRSRQDPADVGLLVALAEATRALPFTTPEAIEHAQVDPALRRAFEQADVETPRDLAEALRRLMDAPAAGVVLRRQQKSRDGRRWQVVPCDVRDDARHRRHTA